MAWITVAPSRRRPPQAASIDRARSTARHGACENRSPFSVLVVVNAFVGGMAGLERSILPAIAEGEFAVAARSSILSFIVVFGLTRRPPIIRGPAGGPLWAKHVLIGGWLVAAPVPGSDVCADWGWIVPRTCCWV